MITEQLIVDRYAHYINSMQRCIHCVVYRPGPSSGGQYLPVNPANILDEHVVDNHMPQSFSSNNHNMYASFVNMAPIAMTAYCMDKMPELTMTILAALVLFIVGSKK
jgi:hypothetical protein